MISKLRKLTYRHELEYVYLLTILANLIVLVTYLVYQSMPVLWIGIVIVNTLLYSYQRSRNRRKNAQVDKILKKSYRKADLMEYLSSLDEFKSALISLNEPEEVSAKICSYIKQVLNSSHVYIYLWDESSGAFYPKPKPDEVELDIFFHVYDPFVLWLSDNPRVVVEHDLDSILDNSYVTLTKGKEFFKRTQSKIVVPLVLNKGLLGILTIGSKLYQNGDYPIDDYERLSEIVEVSVLSLSNATFYKQLISMTETLEAKVKERTRELEDTQSQLVMSEKMASLGVMVAGIAHEINTPAGVINAASDNLEGNVLFTFLHVDDLFESLQNKDIRKSFRKLLVKLLRDQPTTKIDPRNKLKLKREIKDSLKKFNLDEKDSSEASNFLIDNSIPELMEDLAILFQLNSRNLYNILKNGVSAARNIKNIKYSIQNIVRIVKALKYYSHLDQSSYGETDLTDGIENTLIILHSQIKQGIEIERDYHNIPKVYCNIDELNQVWTNLINNSMHALKKITNPKITISIQSVDLAGNPYAVVSIQDNGSGIPKEIVDRIWDPFFTTKDQGEGSGLGLGIVKGIIEKHKGTIKVESEPGNTKFLVYLPIEKPKTD
ncbi:ATP-binding protein [Leptospira sp. GIMC2001]|uniref:ATP-binding protein n=1 Tax=Leptospira sp. GIMC2001 TaxID=1513297 RepID=UPI00234A0037|nr:ATP-binding protein [Leptospira sp. GIMC2001]WCL48754.1 ATP-binding protein [Leptospira sp. GIMC2001]